MTPAVDPRQDPWAIRPEEFPARGSWTQQATFLLRYAVLAPSIYNSQPWRFVLQPSVIELHADAQRRLPCVDPDGREQRISLGAALENLRVAAAHFGFACTVAYDEAAASTRVASVRLASGPADAAAAALLPAITQRRTRRALYSNAPLPAAVAAALPAVGAAAGVQVACLTDQEQRREVARLIAAASHAQAQDPAFRQEVSHWVRTSWSLKGDGMASDVLGVPWGLSGLGAWLMRVLGLGPSSRPLTEYRLATEGSALLILSSADTPAAWVRCGEALQEVLLRCTLAGLSCAFHNEPAQVPYVRSTLRTMLGLALWPQAVLRVGPAAPGGLPTARRPIEHVVQ